MIGDPPSQGSVVAYAYLRGRQHEAREPEGGKMGPMCLILAVGDEAYLLQINSEDHNWIEPKFD